MVLYEPLVPFPGLLHDPEFDFQPLDDLRVLLSALALVAVILDLLLHLLVLVVVFLSEGSTTLISISYSESFRRNSFFRLSTSFANSYARRYHSESPPRRPSKPAPPRERL